MRTDFSEKFARGLQKALEKAEWQEKLHPRKHGKFAPKGGGQAGKAGEVFVAALRGFSTSKIGEIRSLHETQERVVRLNKSIGEEGSALKEGSGMPTKVLKKQKAFGAWYEEKEGKKISTMEPSFAVAVEGNEDDILKEAAGLGKDFDQAAVLVAVHDPAGEGVMFRLDLDPSTVNDDVRGSVVQHFLDAGLGGATSLLDQPSFRLAAMSQADAEVIREAAKHLPAEFKAKLTGIPARVRFVGSDEYDSILGGKAAAEETVVADVIIGGVRRPLRAGKGE